MFFFIKLLSAKVCTCRPGKGTAKDYQIKDYGFLQWWPHHSIRVRTEWRGSRWISKIQHFISASQQPSKIAPFFLHFVSFSQLLHNHLPSLIMFWNQSMRICPNWPESICPLEPCGKYTSSTLDGAQLTMSESRRRAESQFLCKFCYGFSFWICFWGQSFCSFCHAASSGMVPS